MINTQILRKIVLLITILTFISCQKDKTTDSPQFIVGIISENSIYKKFDPSLKLIPGNNMYGFNVVHDSIDVDNNGQYDFVFICQNELNSNTLDKESYIIINNGKFEIAYDEVIDTNNVYVSERNDTVYEYEYSYFKPFNIPDIDTLIKEYYPTSEPAMCNDGTRPSELNRWTSYNNLFFSEKDSSTYRWENLKEVRFTNIEKGIWNGSGEKYLVYRLKKENGLIYYGWLKIETSDFCNIQIFESCFQKDGFRE